MFMTSSITKNSIHHLCPRIIDSQTEHISFGGNQAWLSRNTAAKAGGGPISVTNIIVTYAKSNEDYAKHLNISFCDNGLINQTDYLILLNDVYRTVKPHEFPIFNRIYDRLARNNRFFTRVNPGFLVKLRKLSKGMLRFGLKKDIFLQPRTLSTLFCGYTRGLTFIKLAVSNGYPVALLTTSNSHSITIFDHPHLYDGRNEKMKKHIVTIINVLEVKSEASPELVITTWGKTATISYDELYKSWQSIRAIGSGMVYFIPAKDKKTVKKCIRKTRRLFYKR